ncbi:ABA4-like family protein [Candidatus Pelagibacter sp.]|uniref:ABA4-like family protein n=1 Tax=Candidatus Pelagibacter sp. TaxID=2024849 RepID=UPI003F86B3A9
MIEQIYTYFTIETLYMWINLGVLPFWFILIAFPQSHLSRIFVTSIFPFFILSGVYIFILYKSYLIGYDFDGNFSLYLGLSELSRLFEDHLYIMIFWTHFIAINLFIGGWIVKDSQKFSINKVLMAVPLIVTYLIGPIGLILYWIIRIFYAKRVSLYE